MLAGGPPHVLVDALVAVQGPEPRHAGPVLGLVLGAELLLLDVLVEVFLGIGRVRSDAHVDALDGPRGGQVLGRVGKEVLVYFLDEVTLQVEAVSDPVANGEGYVLVDPPADAGAFDAGRNSKEANGSPLVRCNSRGEVVKVAEVHSIDGDGRCGGLVERKVFSAALLSSPGPVKDIVVWDSEGPARNGLETSGEGREGVLSRNVGVDGDDVGGGPGSEGEQRSKSDVGSGF